MYISLELMLESESESEVAQSCPTLCDPVDYSLLGSSVHGILQARVLEWVAIAFSYRYLIFCALQDYKNRNNVYSFVFFSICVAYKYSTISSVQFSCSVLSDYL